MNVRVSTKTVRNLFSHIFDHLDILSDSNTMKTGIINDVSLRSIGVFIMQCGFQTLSPIVIPGKIICRVFFDISIFKTGCTGYNSFMSMEIFIF